MTRHNEIRDGLLSAARDLGLDARSEVVAQSWPSHHVDGRADLVILDPFTVVEVKVDAAQYDDMPPLWRGQLDRYTRLFGTWSDRWLVSDTYPRAWEHYQLFLQTGWRVTTAADFTYRLSRLALEGTPLCHLVRRERVA